MHARLADNLLDEQMLERFEEGTSLRGRRQVVVRLLVLLRKDAVGDALAWREVLPDEVGVILACKFELDCLWHLIVDVRCVVIVLLDLLERMLKLADVHAGRADPVLAELS